MLPDLPCFPYHSFPMPSPLNHLLPPSLPLPRHLPPIPYTCGTFSSLINLIFPDLFPFPSNFSRFLWSNFLSFDTFLTVPYLTSPPCLFFIQPEPRLPFHIFLPCPSLPCRAFPSHQFLSCTKPQMVSLSALLCPNGVVPLQSTLPWATWAKGSP